MTGHSDGDHLDRHTVHVPAHALPERSFLLGDRGGFVLYMPLSTNHRDATAHGSKWYGASGFGQSFLDSLVTWVEIDGERIDLNRTNQVGFTMRLDEAIRTFEIDGMEIQERYFVPNGTQAVVLRLEGELVFGIRPELDMRYYQAFNSDFSSYAFDSVPAGAEIRNRVTDVGPLNETLNFFGLIGTVEDSAREIVPPDERLIHKTYLKDENREKAIESVYSETGQKVADEAPIWNKYSTMVYSPVIFRARGPLTLVCAFGSVDESVRATFQNVVANLETMRRAKRAVIAHDLAEGAFETGNPDVDNAYAHLLTRFNDCLVARDASVQASGQQRDHYYAIFAGNKYFMDAWKRDENISLRALLATNDFKTVREILDDTWQDQDERTGRLPHIIRAGEPLVYYSSDGTLWALHRLFQYTRESGDRTLLQQKLPMVEHFFRASQSFVRRGLLPSGGIIDSDYLWETWEDTPFTPRAGYPVEIELLWLTCLGEYAACIEDRSLADWMQRAYEEGQHTFEEFFGENYLYDSLGYDWAPSRLLTPNGYLTFDLGYPLPAALATAMIPLARDQLAGRRGVRSLAPRDWPEVFPKAFLDDPRSHTGKNMASFGIFNYHRGIEWEWFNSAFVQGELTHGDVEHAWSTYTHKQVNEALNEAGIGGLSELYDEHGQLGADFQAWSMAAAIDSLHRYAGIEVDATAKRIGIAPWIPAAWPHLRLRSRIGDLPFDVEYESTGHGQHHLVVAPLHGGAEGYTVDVTFRVPRGSRILASSRESQALDATIWSVTGTDTDAHVDLARATLPLHDGIDVRLSAG
jgi:glycogen debranching enzyme